MRRRSRVPMALVAIAMLTSCVVHEGSETQQPEQAAVQAGSHQPAFALFEFVPQSNASLSADDQVTQVTDSIESTVRSDAGIVCTGISDSAGQQLADQVVGAEHTLAAATDLSFALYDHDSGVTCSWLGEEEYNAASVIKVATVITRLWQSEASGAPMSPDEYLWAELAITVSDNDAQSALWYEVGGFAGVAAMFDSLGLTIAQPVDMDAWGLTRISAESQLGLITKLIGGSLLDHRNTSYVLDLMARVHPDQAWGVSAGASADDTTSLKNGWLDDYEWSDLHGWYDLSWTINSIGHVESSTGSYSLVILSDQNPSMEAGIDLVQQVAETLAEAVQLS